MIDSSFLTQSHHIYKFYEFFNINSLCRWQWTYAASTSVYFTKYNLEKCLIVSIVRVKHIIPLKSLYTLMYTLLITDVNIYIYGLYNHIYNEMYPIIINLSQSVKICHKLNSHNLSFSVFIDDGVVVYEYICLELYQI